MTILLENRKDLDPNFIVYWGSSSGTYYLATNDHPKFFLRLKSSESSWMIPLWETFLEVSA